MKRDRVFWLVLPLVTLFPVAFLLSAATGSKDEPRYTSGCLDCHEDYDKTLAGGVHQLHAQGAGAVVFCSSCHPGGAAHMDDPDENKPLNIGAAGVAAGAAVCASCHADPHQQNMLERNVHGQSDVNCGSCHAVHGNDRARLLKKDEPELCLSCHREVSADFSKSFRHPVEDGVVKCSDCHMALDQSHRQHTYAGATGLCNTCHNQFRGPFPFEHQPTMEFSTEEGGCLNCHAAHGSNVPRMLKQSYESPNFALCAQCHVVPKHQFNTRHGPQWAGVPCSDCHVDIHGSYQNRNLLTPALQAQGCFAVGCHQQ